MYAYICLTHIYIYIYIYRQMLIFVSVWIGVNNVNAACDGITISKTIVSADIRMYSHTYAIRQHHQFNNTRTESITCNRNIGIYTRFTFDNLYFTNRLPFERKTNETTKLRTSLRDIEYKSSRLLNCRYTRPRKRNRISLDWGS